MKKIITICAFAACLTGCDDLFEPAIENNLGLEYMYENSQYAEGILANAYTRIPCAGYSFNDVATDDVIVIPNINMESRTVQRNKWSDTPYCPIRFAYRYACPYCTWSMK